MSGDRVRADTFGRVPTGMLFRPGPDGRPSEASDISDGAIRLYAILSRYGDQFNPAFPSRRRLATNTGCSVDTIDRRLRELEAAGWIRVEHVPTGRGDLTGNHYHLLNGGWVAAPVRPRTKPV